MIRVLTFFALLAFGASAKSAVNHVDKKVGELQPTYAVADCFYFKLKGIAEADPVKPGVAWFAVSRTDFGAKEAYATLLTAKLMDANVRIITSGGISCGYAGVAEILIQ